MKQLAGFLILIFLAWACHTQAPTDSLAQEIIAKSVKVHGGNHYQQFDVAFDFRQFRVRIQQEGPRFRYERVSTDTLNNQLNDVLTNEGFTREINGSKQTLSAKDESRYRESLNSVAYFVLLPYKLTDAAVNAQHVGTTTLAGQPYDKIKVWFDAEGGGKDHEDIFCYWFHQKNHTLDYLSYANGGPRFRKATKRSTIGGIVFQDYENYEILDSTLATTEYDAAFVAGKVKLLSKIEQTNYTTNTPTR